MGRKSREKRERREARKRSSLVNPVPTIGGRIEELKKQLELMAGGDAEFWSSEELPPDFEESYLEDIVAFESVETGLSLFEGLKQNGIELPDPETLDEEESREKVIEILAALADLRVFIIGDDGMSGHQLYSILWKETLWEGCYVKRKNPASMTMIDVSRGFKAKMRRALRSLQKRAVIH